MTRSDKSIILAVLMIIVGGGVALFMIGKRSNNNSRNESKQYIDSLFRESDKTNTFDSIRSEIDRKLVDSIRVIRDEINAERSTRRKETQRISRETNILRHRIDSIGPINRPDL